MNDKNKNYYPFIPLVLFAIAFVAMNGKAELVIGVLLGIFFTALVVGPDLRRHNLSKLNESETNHESEV